MELLCLEDFKETKLDPNWTAFDYLLEAAKVGLEKMQKPNFKLRYGEVKKRHDFGYLKYFLYNAPEPPTQTLWESLDKNVGLKNKRKLKEEDDEEWEELKQKLKRSKKEKPVRSIPPPDLPENFKQHIVEKKGGSGWILVIQKPLFYSDVNPQASRFSMPFSQLKTHEFLNKTEAEDLDDEKGMKVCLLEPSMEEISVTLKKWKYTGKSSSYVMTSTWNSVVKDNRLKIDDIVQLWSFRAKSKLCFALVKVQVPTRN
ncbi:B3 domain-containing protein At5g24050-like [Durio zibethinus]|uniref:B3 domain-containing protein At5g24050-like n=1 Tax=Durio zibethinus TaxID=66656 RepID=A0A6P6BFH0_DURZI|nr:B3 domain-containing protein At5g24050-like [Durio zibethinus]